MWIGTDGDANGKGGREGEKGEGDLGGDRSNVVSQCLATPCSFRLSLLIIVTTFVTVFVLIITIFTFPL